MFHFRMSGLSVRSDIDLPGLIADAEALEASDVTIARGTVPSSLARSSAKGPTWEIADDQFLLRIPGVARFLLTGGTAIVFEIEDNAPDGDVAIFLIGTVFGILLHQRQQIVLHASAVRVGDKAVLFCGPSGAGKSTLAAALGQRGYALLNDDVCAIGQDDAGALFAHPDGRRLKLWAQSIKHLDLADRQGAAVRTQLEKFYVEPKDAFSEALPLGAVYALRETRPPGQDGVERPNIVDAALLVRGNAYRPRMVVAMGQKTPYFQLAANIAGSAGVFHLTRPFNFAVMPDVMGWLEAHWREIGLLGAAA